MAIEQDKISYKLDLKEKLKEIPRASRKDATEEIGRYLLDSIFNDTDSQKSPVTGQKFKPLKKGAYRNIKKKVAGNTKANLRLKEKMLPSLRFKNNASSVELLITNKKEAAKAFNHITGDTLPSRPFIPDDKGEKVKPKLKGKNQFRTSIVRGIDDIIEDYL